MFCTDGIQKRRMSRTGPTVVEVSLVVGDLLKLQLLSHHDTRKLQLSAGAGGAGDRLAGRCAAVVRTDGSVFASLLVWPQWSPHWHTATCCECPVPPRPLRSRHLHSTSTTSSRQLPRLLASVTTLSAELLLPLLFYPQPSAVHLLPVNVFMPACFVLHFNIS